MKNKNKYVYVTHKLKIKCADKLEHLSQITGKTKAELLENMIEEMYRSYFESDYNQNNQKNHNFSENVFEQELKDTEQRWKSSNEGLNDFNQRMEDWKKEEKRKNTKQAEEFKKKLDDWARTWEKYFRNYSSSIRKNKSHQFKYFDPNENPSVWKKKMREYTKQWHPDYAPDDGNPQEFGEMKAEYDILIGKINNKEYSL